MRASFLLRSWYYVVVLCTLPACSRTAGRSGSVDAHDGVAFRGVVENVTSLIGFEGSVILVGLDQGWVISVRMVDDSPETETAAGETLHIAVHSPVMVFGRKPWIGRRYRFELLERQERGYLRIAAEPQ